jgi:hypothetical protein
MYRYVVGAAVWLFLLSLASVGCAGNGGSTGSGGGGGGSATGGSGGTGGSAGAGGGAGAGGAAGASNGSTGGAGGASGGSGGGGAAGSGGTGPAPCSSLPFCDDFESSKVDGGPSSTLWTLVNGNGGSNATATIDSMGAHGSSKSVKINGTSRIWLRNSSVIGTLGDVVHVRFYVQFMSALPMGHVAFFSTDPTKMDQYTDQPQLRFGGQDMVLHWNTSTDAANIPTVGPGDSLSFRPATGKWYCMELTINKANGHLNVSIDGADQSGLTEDGVATMNIDDAWVASSASQAVYSTLAEFNIGWVSFGGGPNTLWFDDVALSPNPIGCY